MAWCSAATTTASGSAATAVTCTLARWLPRCAPYALTPKHTSKSSPRTINNILNSIHGGYLLRLIFNEDNTFSILPVVHTVVRNIRTKEVEVQNWGYSYYKDEITGSKDTYLGNKYLACLHNIIISSLDLEPIDTDKFKTTLINSISYK